ncbi:MAG: HEAT repeat protein [Myxococcota bacterium]|jgi:HEAT repeat protein
MASSLRVVLTGLALGGAFGAGTWFAQPDPPVVIAPMAESERPWTEALAASRASAQAGTLRAEALAVLDGAEGSRELADAVELLGWVGQDADMPVLELLAAQSDPVLTDPARESIGRIGSPLSVAVLARSLDGAGPPDQAELLRALGQTRHELALPVLEVWLRRPGTVDSAASALARHGSDEAAALVGAAFVRARSSDLMPLAAALSEFGEDHRSARGLLHRALDARGTPQQRAAADVLAQVGDPIVHQRLRDELISGPASRRLRAARALGAFGDPSDVPLLVETAATAERGVRGAAIWALGRLDRRGERALAHLVREGPTGPAGDAIYALPMPGREPALGALLHAATARARPLRERACGVLFAAEWAGGAPLDVVDLARTMAASDHALAGQAFGFLLKYGEAEDRWRVEEALFDGSTGSRTAAIQSLSDQPGPWATELLVALVEDPDVRVADAAVRALQDRVGDESVLEEALLERMRSGQSTQGTVEQALIASGSARGLTAVVDAARHGTWQEWNASINALANSGARVHMEALEEILARTEEPRRRQRLYQAMMWSDSASAEGVAERLLDEDSPELRALGVQALARSGGPEAVARLLRLAEDADPQVRGAALDTLPEVAGPAGVQVLTRQAQDPAVAWRAISGLQRIGSADARAALVELADGDAVPEVRAAAIQGAAWQAGPDLRRAIERAVDDDDERVREAAVSALQTMGTSAAAEALSRALGSSHDSTARRAAGALEGLGGRVAEAHSDQIAAAKTRTARVDAELADTGLW